MLSYYLFHFCFWNDFLLIYLLFFLRYLHIGLRIRLNSSMLFYLLFLWLFLRFDIALNLYLRQSQIAKPSFQHLLDFPPSSLICLHKNSPISECGQDKQRSVPDQPSEMFHPNQQYLRPSVYYKQSMTTAHRPTWKPAYGLSDNVNKGYVPTRAYSARDLPSYLRLKQRKIGQGAFDELKDMDFKSELLKREAAALRKKNGEIDITEDKQITYGRDTSVYAADVDYIGNYEPDLKKRIKRPDEEEGLVDLADNPFPEDADSEQFIKDNSEQEKEKKPRVHSQSEQDDEDDSEQLLREYERIKQQREKEELHKREQKHKQSMANRESQLLKGNPLIDSSFSLTKRWYEDTVFRNQAKKVEQKKSYINDYVRSDFHRKFMHRYVGR